MDRRLEQDVKALGQEVNAFAEKINVKADEDFAALSARLETERNKIKIRTTYADSMEHLIMFLHQNTNWNAARKAKTPLSQLDPKTNAVVRYTYSVSSDILNFLNVAIKEHAAFEKRWRAVYADTLVSVERLIDIEYLLPEYKADRRMINAVVKYMKAQ